MKLLTKAAPQAPPPPVPTPSIAYQDCTPADPDTPIDDQPGEAPFFTVVAVTPITFKDAALPVKKVRYAPGIRAWMDHDGGVKNWVTGCLAMFAVVDSLLSVTCPVPDQWREDMGDAIHLEKFETKEEGRFIRVME